MSFWAPTSAGLMAEKPRRLALLRVAPEMVVGLMHNLNAGRHITSAGLPADAEFVSVDYDWRLRCLVLTLESAEFQELHPGAMLPYLNVMLTDHGPWEIPESA